MNSAENEIRWRLRLIFLGTMGFYSENWSDHEYPFWILAPPGHDYDHQAKICVPTGLVNSQTSDSYNEEIDGWLCYHLCGEHVDFDWKVQTNFEKPHRILKRPRPCHADCGQPGTAKYRFFYRNQRNNFNWLASVERLAPLDGNGNEFEIDPHLLESTLQDASCLQARLSFSAGNFRTHLMAGEVDPNAMNPNQHSKFEIQYRRGPNSEQRRPVDVALTSSIAGEFEVMGKVQIVTTNLASGNEVKTIELNAPAEGKTVDVKITNLPSAEYPSPSKGTPLEHFRMLYRLLKVGRRDTENWPVPTYQGRWSSTSKRSLIAGDEACPPGCFNCR